MLLKEMGKSTEESTIENILCDIVKSISVNSKVIRVFENGKVI